MTVAMPEGAGMGRRGFLLTAGAAGIAALGVTGRPAFAGWNAEERMYGIIGRINAVPGEREALAAILLAGTADMPGCLSYVVAVDPADPDALWVTEVWDSAESHQASLTLPTVQKAIASGKPLIAGFAERVVTAPVGGHGLR